MNGLYADQGLAKVSASVELTACSSAGEQSEAGCDGTAESNGS
jgi:hypothetical protein